MKKGLIIFAATVDSVASRKDKTLAVRLGTQETSGEVGGLLFNLQNAVVTVAIKEEMFGADEVEMLESIKADPFNTKSVSAQDTGFRFPVDEVRNYENKAPDFGEDLPF